jgi:hypothetical protein
VRARFKSCISLNDGSFLKMYFLGAIKAGEETYAGLMALFNAIKQQ